MAEVDVVRPDGGGGSMADGQTVPVAVANGPKALPLDFCIFMAAMAVIVSLALCAAFYQQGRESARTQKERDEEMQRVVSAAKFGVGDRVVILVGRLEGQVMSGRYNDGEMEYLVKFQKWVRAEGPIIERSEAVEQWFREFELSRPEEAPPFYSAWIDHGRTGRREISALNDAPPPPAPNEDDEVDAPKPDQSRFEGIEMILPLPGPKPDSSMVRPKCRVWC